MKALVLILIVGLLVVIAWKTTQRADSAAHATERLREVIGRSNLPPAARQEMLRLLEAGRTRPSRFGDAA